MSDPFRFSRRLRQGLDRRPFSGLLLLILLGQTPAFAENENPDLHSSEFSNCSWYRAKRANVPVYAEPDRSGEIKSRLRLGENVCYIGEKKGFAILDWEKQALVRKEKQGAYSGEGFVRLTELSEHSRSTINLPGDEHTVQQTWELGASPEDPLWILRPFLGMFLSPDPCADPSKIGCAPGREK